MEKVSYYLSASGRRGGNKTIWLYRGNGFNQTQICRFTSDLTAKLFADELGFPLSDALKGRLTG